MEKKPKDKRKNDHLIEGSIMLGIGVVFMLILVGVFGKAGKAVTDFFVGSFGYAVYAYFLALIIMGILTICNVKRPKIGVWRTLSIIMFFAMIIALFHCVSSTQHIEGGYSNYLADCYNKHNTAGGVIAGVFLYPLLLVDFLGIVICSLLALAFGAVFVFYNNIVALIKGNKQKDAPISMTDFKSMNAEGDFEIVQSNLMVESDGDIKSKGGNSEEYIPLEESRSTKVDFDSLTAEDNVVKSKFARLKDRNLLSSKVEKDKKADFDNAYNILYGNNDSDKKKDSDETAPTISPIDDKSQYESYTNDYRKQQILDNLNINKGNSVANKNADSIMSNNSDYFAVDTISLDKTENVKKDNNSANSNESNSLNVDSVQNINGDKSEKNAYTAFENKESNNDKKEDNFFDFFGRKSQDKKKESVATDSNLNNDNAFVSYQRLNDFEDKKTEKKEILENSKKSKYDDLPVEDKTATHSDVEGFESLLKKQKEERERIAKSSVDRRHNLTENNFEVEEAEREQKRKERSDKGGTHYSSKLDNPQVTQNVEDKKVVETAKVPQFEKAVQPITPTVPAEKPKEEIKKEKTRIKLAPYKYPPIELLKDYDSRPPANENFDDKIAILETTLSEFGIDAKVNRVVTGPTFSRLELVMPKGIPVKRVLSYVDDIAMCLEVKSVRCQIPIPGKNAFGVEIPNAERGKVGLKSVIQSDVFAKTKQKLSFAVGQNCDGENYAADLSQMPHLLIAGATGAGKSVCLNSLIVSLMYKYTPEELRLLLVDPKQVELNMYNRIPHMLIPEAVSDKDKTLNLLDWAIEEMELRYTMFKDRRVQKITDYNAIIDPKKEDRLPYIVIIIDEVGDFMMVMKKELEERIVRLTQKARAAGIHLILATQRPSVDVITGTIKANLPARIAFAVPSFTDSKTIIDQGGAEKLLRYGDMIFSDGVNEPTRLQGTLIEGEEVNAVCDYVRDNNECYFDKDIEEFILNTNTNAGANAAQTTFGEGSSGEQDDLFVRALYHVVTTGAVSISKLQRKFGIGFPRAARLVDTMEELGYIGAAKDNKQRDILIDMPTMLSKYGDVSLE